VSQADSLLEHGEDADRATKSGNDLCLSGQGDPFIESSLWERHSVHDVCPCASIYVEVVIQEHKVENDVESIQEDYHVVVAFSPNYLDDVLVEFLGKTDKLTMKKISNAL
jgi:hypothetical protein